MMGLYDKYLNGDKLTDEEIRAGAAFFPRLANDLFACGPTFRLASREMRRVGDEFIQFNLSRVSRLTRVK